MERTRRKARAAGPAAASPRFRFGVVVLAVVAAAAALVAYLASPTPLPVSVKRPAAAAVAADPTSAADPAVASTRATSASSDSRQDRRRRTFELPPLRSFAGIQVDGDVKLDAKGRVVPTRELRRLFDFFLTATGEIGADRIATLLRRYLEQHQLPADAVAETMDLFERYNRYKTAFTEQIAINRADPDAMRQALRARAELRRTMLGVAVADAFFHDDEIVDQYTVARLAIVRDPTLSAAEKERQLALLRDTLAPDVAAREEREIQLARLSQETAALRTAGASAADIYRLRAQRLGDAAAQRLEQLDQERDQWRQRLDDFYRARAEILANPDITPEQQRAAIDELAHARFSPTERLRLSALDQIHRTNHK